MSNFEFNSAQWEIFKSAITRVADGATGYLATIDGGLFTPNAVATAERFAPFLRSALGLKTIGDGIAEYYRTGDLQSAILTSISSAVGDISGGLLVARTALLATAIFGTGPIGIGAAIATGIIFGIGWDEIGAPFADYMLNAFRSGMTNLFASGEFPSFSQMLSTGFDDLSIWLQNKITSPLIALFRDPLIIDLDGDGITLTALGVAGQEGASGVFFDYDGDGFGERTGWVSPNDGILVHDRNHNGSVDGASEIFGSPDQDGYAVLETLDSNGDGVIDAADRAFADLRIWRDLNGNGVADAGELQTLGEAGLASLNLTRTDVSGTNNGHTRGFSGVVTRTDGTTTTAETIYFQTDRRTTQDNTPPFTPAEGIDKLPQLPGSGQISAIGLKLTQDVAFRAVWGQREELRLAA
jgi:hypothetical protein